MQLQGQKGGSFEKESFSETNVTSAFRVMTVVSYYALDFRPILSIRYEGKVGAYDLNPFKVMPYTP
jgi:hypothetical protein